MDKPLGECYILLVGAGGIGCEVIKNLVLSGITKVDLIDLDTIDVSNLNRQFLFRPHHVGMPKSVVAAEAAKHFNSAANTTAYHSNIKSGEYNTSFFGKYDLVMNALDNVDARRHVNRLCLAAGVPLMESGTTGYLGQIMPIIKGQTECYECQPKPSQKTYPICTIRQTPDKPVHCIVWAKELFKLLFGNTSESMLFEDPATASSTSHMHLLPLSQYASASELQDYVQRLVTCLFQTEIVDKRELGAYKTLATPPQEISSRIISEGVALGITAIHHLQSPTASCSWSPDRESAGGWSQRIWSLEQAIAEITCCIYDALQREKDQNSGLKLGEYVFDKDDSFAMCFVTASALLRSHVFHIEKKSLHDTKGIAGNIIPAIASTNAIIAGLQTLEAIKILQQKRSGNYQPKMCFCARYPSRLGVYLQPMRADEPNKQCFVCSSSQIVLQIDTETATLDIFVSQVLKKSLGFVEPFVLKGSNIIYEQDEDADASEIGDMEERMKTTRLVNVCGGGIHHDTLLDVMDYFQDIKTKILIKHVNSADVDEEKAPGGFTISAANNIPDILKTQEGGEGIKEDDIVLVERYEGDGELAGKRARLK